MAESRKPQSEGEVRDVPFLKNDMKEHAPTTGKQLDKADAPGRADSELTVDEETEKTDKK